MAWLVPLAAGCRTRRYAERERCARLELVGYHAGRTSPPTREAIASSRKPGSVHELGSAGSLENAHETCRGPRTRTTSLPDARAAIARRARTSRNAPASALSRIDHGSHSHPARRSPSPMPPDTPVVLDLPQDPDSSAIASASSVPWRRRESRTNSSSSRISACHDGLAPNDDAPLLDELQGCLKLGLLLAVVDLARWRRPKECRSRAC